MEILGPEKGKGGVKCYGCGEIGHLSKDCPTNKAKGKVSKAVNACVKVAPTPCPACDGQHSFQSNGETLYTCLLVKSSEACVWLREPELSKGQDVVSCALIGQASISGKAVRQLLKQANHMESAQRWIMELSVA